MLLTSISHDPKFGIPKLPWIDDDVIHLCRKKESTRRKAIIANKQQHWDKYKNFRRQLSGLSDLVRRKQNDYLIAITSSLKDNYKRFWSFYRAKSKSPRIPSTISFDNQNVSTSATKANMFNSFLQSTFKTPDKFTERFTDSTPRTQERKLNSISLTQKKYLLHH